MEVFFYILATIVLSVQNNSLLLWPLLARPLQGPQRHLSLKAYCFQDLRTPLTHTAQCADRLTCPAGLIPCTLQPRSAQVANEKFADVVLSEYCQQDVVWVQDYHLMLLPSLLKQAVPKVGQHAQHTRIPFSPSMLLPTFQFQDPASS